jgi:hypothetical protein
MNVASDDESPKTDLLTPECQSAIRAKLMLNAV